MKSIVAVLCLVAGQSAAEDFVCTLTDLSCVTDCARTQIAFAIDRTQFVAPQNPNDPPRRQITTVTLNDEAFVAQAIAVDGGFVGFHFDADSGTTLMIVQPDGTARLSRQPQGQVLTGSCTRR